MNVYMNTARPLLLTVVLATHAFVIEALDFFGFSHSQHGTIVLYLQNVSSVKPTGLHAGEAACRCGRVSCGRYALVVIDEYLHLSSFEF
jgi:hypothetical protein